MPFKCGIRKIITKFSKKLRSSEMIVNYHFTGCNNVDPSAACSASPEITKMAPLNSNVSSNTRMSCGKISIPAAVPAIDKPTAESVKIDFKKLNIYFLVPPYLGRAYAWNSDLMQRMQHLWQAPLPSLWIKSN